nr:circularly permutated Ras protein 1-like isoform X2 [Paramormyrops kingsleyae]XP_023695621.1 circularly permutated Ras protein 1-like isoform X2 [Paramormyrops kingsleyae]XP_023695622.1 circularly permutated Ras protein 1-like isoform X2 [Paramormyrops kingsleyae]XP_023695623.1 circularly permutated Ras protein 1-like isoform X2 [Paramormyrops kingsleyae]
MEFACGFVYVPQPANLKSAQKQTPAPLKRSPLLPPPYKPRAHSPTPPAHPLPPPQKNLEGSARNASGSPECWTSVHVHRDTTCQMREKTDTPTSQVLPLKPLHGERKKALLRPPMKFQLGRLSPPNFLFGQSRSVLPHEQRQGDSLCKQGDKSESESVDSDCGSFHQTPGGARAERRHPQDIPKIKQSDKPALVPLQSSSSFLLNRLPEYEALSNKHSSIPPSDPMPSSHSPNSLSEVLLDKQLLPGNPNVILVAVGKLVTEENVNTIECEPTACSQCGSARESLYDNLVENCYFCQPWKSSQGYCATTECQDFLFPLTPEPKPPTDPLLIFCIDISGSMTVMSQITEDGRVTYKSRLQCVQQAVLQCVQSLSEREPNTRVGLITFNKQLCLHGNGKAASQFLCGAQLMDCALLKEAVSSFPDPPPLAESRAWLEREVHSLYSLLQLSSLPLSLENTGDKALGPAALAAITMASRHPGSRVVICTDGKANTWLGNLDVPETDCRSLVPSSIFYQDLGEFAANQGITVSVLTIEGTDCRLDELGRLFDLTGGNVAIASLSGLCTAFESVMERKAVATHCTVTLLLPTALSVRGEREAGHKVIRQVGNVFSDTEITFQFGAKEQDTATLLSASKVWAQLQIRYRSTDGRTVLRVLTVHRRVTADSSQVLSSLSLPILQLNLSQSSAALAVRGRYKEAWREGETQAKLMEMFLDYVRSVEEEQKHRQWVEIMDPIFNSIDIYTRAKPFSMSDIQALTDAGAALLFTMKNGSRTSALPRSMVLVGPAEMAQAC